MPERIRAGFVGTGFMADVHVRAVRAAGGVPAVIAGSTAEKAADAARRLGVDRSVADLDELLGDPGVDVVHVLTPNALHAEQAGRVLAAGKHVVCEKPLAISSAEAEELSRVAADRGLVAVVPFVYRFHPLVREARARLAAGRIVTVQGSYLQDWLLGDDAENWRVHSDTGGRSRAFADIGSHLVDLIEFVAGERVVRLVATTSIAVPLRGGRTVTTEDSAALTVVLARGGVGTLLVSQVAPGRKNRLSFEIATDDESVLFDQEHPESIWVGRKRDSLTVPRDPDALSPEARRLSVLPAGHPQGYLDAFTAFIGDAYDAVRGTVHDGLPTFEDGLRAVRVTEAVLRSANEGRWVDVPPPEAALAMSGTNRKDEER